MLFLGSPCFHSLVVFMGMPYANIYDNIVIGYIRKCGLSVKLCPHTRMCLPVWRDDHIIILVRLVYVRHIEVMYTPKMRGM